MDIDIRDIDPPFTITGHEGTWCVSEVIARAEAFDLEAAFVAAVTLCEDGADFADIQSDGKRVGVANRTVENGVPVIRRGR